MPGDYPTILLIEDDEDIREAVGIILEEEGYRFLTAGNLVETVEHLRRAKPDLVLLDLTLPDAEPEEVVARLRSFFPDVPIVILSGVQDIGTRARELGAADHLEKPFHMRDLLETVGRFTRRER